MTEILKVFKALIFSPAFAGTIGAILAIIWHKPDMAMMAFYLISGFFGAMWGAEPIVHWQGIGEGWVCIVAMIIGVFAGSLIGMLLKFIKSGAAQRLIEDFFLRRKRGKEDD